MLTLRRLSRSGRTTVTVRPLVSSGIDVYYSYTHVLRHPVIIIGRIAGWRLPWVSKGSPATRS
ncbi:MAG: hypothetical protein ACRDU9_06400 [Acidimicrobiia bacterium]